jgi:CRISPR system Cascade subunit CasA
VGLDAPRADFAGALVQLLIGVVQTACPPQDDRDWAMQFQHPPSPATLRSKVAGIAEHFNLADPATPFMQVADLADGVAWPVAKLFLEQPGNQTLDQNRDLFQRRGTITGSVRPCRRGPLHPPVYGAGRGRGTPDRDPGRRPAHLFGDRGDPLGDGSG